MTSSPGATVSFPFRVTNSGLNEAQYKITARFFTSLCNPDCGAPPSTKIFAGRVGTALNESDGYYTPPIAGGTTSKFTLKATVPASAPLSPSYFGQMDLYDTSGNHLDIVSFQIDLNPTTASTNPTDETISTSGGKSTVVAGSGLLPTYITSASQKFGGTAHFKVALINHSTSPTTILFDLELAFCTDAFTTVVKAGTTDVTEMATRGDYETPLLAPGGHQNLTITMKWTAAFGTCGADAGWEAISTDGNFAHSRAAGLIVNPAVP